MLTDAVGGIHIVRGAGAVHGYSVAGRI